jgi:hypothetical protein
MDVGSRGSHWPFRYYLAGISFLNYILWRKYKIAETSHKSSATKGAHADTRLLIALYPLLVPSARS